MKEIKKDDYEVGSDFEEDVYTEEGRDELIDNDEIDASEEAFMEGYENTDLAYCDNCKKLLEREHIEKEFSGDRYSFCSDECVDEYERKRASKS